MTYKLFFIFSFCTCVLQHAIGQSQLTLEEVVALAITKNYDIRVAENSLEAAQTDEDYVTGAFLPQINGVGSVMQNASNQRVEFSDATRNNAGDTKSKNLTGSIQLSWLLFDGTRMFATKRRVEEIARQGEWNVKNQMTNSIATVISNYYDVVRGKQQLKAIREQMAVSEERVKLAEKKLQVGTGGKPELLQAKVDLNAQRTQILSQQTLIGQLKAQLNGFVDMQLPENFDVADTIIIDLNLEKEALSQNIEHKNFSLLSAESDVSIANQMLKERRGERYPFLYFNSNYNFTKNTNTVAINNFSPLFNQAKGLNYGLSITVPILNNFNNRRQIRQASLNVDRQQLLYLKQKTSVNVQLESAFIDYENAKQVLLIEEDNILLAKENVFIALEGFKRAITTSIELRTAQQSLGDAYFRLISARYTAKLAETELLRLNGGLLR